MTALVREAAIAALREHMKLWPLLSGHAELPGSLPTGPDRAPGGSLHGPADHLSSGPEGNSPHEVEPLPCRDSQGSQYRAAEVLPQCSDVVVEMKHFLAAVAKIRPSVAEKVIGHLKGAVLVYDIAGKVLCPNAVHQTGGVCPPDEL